MHTVVGRDLELAAIASFLDLADGAPRALVVEGEAGIGKTTLCRASVRSARERGYLVLECAGDRSETQLSFAALRDLLDDVFDEVADELPPPQRQALAVILLRDESSGAPPTPETIAV